VVTSTANVKRKAMRKLRMIMRTTPEFLSNGDKNIVPGVPFRDHRYGMGKITYTCFGEAGERSERLIFLFLQNPR
jgi:hypothetical protein